MLFLFRSLSLITKNNSFFSNGILSPKQAVSFILNLLERENCLDDSIEILRFFWNSLTHKNYNINKFS